MQDDAVKRLNELYAKADSSVSDDYDSEDSIAAEA